MYTNSFGVTSLRVYVQVEEEELMISIETAAIHPVSLQIHSVMYHCVQRGRRPEVNCSLVKFSY